MPTRLINYDFCRGATYSHLSVRHMPNESLKPQEHKGWADSLWHPHSDLDCGLACAANRDLQLTLAPSPQTH
eukprot:5866954-Amphidinium_carterae.1